MTLICKFQMPFRTIVLEIRIADKLLSSVDFIIYAWIKAFATYFPRTIRQISLNLANLK